MSTHTYDVVGVGIGPFNLGLAALADPLDDVDALFLDQREGFSWHPGMMLEGATIQVPFLADLVTMADPTSPYSFLAFLKDVGRLYPFYVRESFYPLRAEYDQYCRWVADRLTTLRWGRRVVAVERDTTTDLLVVRAEVTGPDGTTTTETYRARHVVLGTGTSPRLPAPLAGLAAEAADHPGAGPVVHTADYLPHRDALRASGAVTVVGSGQSAAEVYRDLLEEAGRPDAGGPGYRVDWVTRSSRFFPMEYTKLTLEMTSPEYTDHYRSLPTELRDLLGREQRNLYKGISSDLVDDIHDTLYRRSVLGQELPTVLLSDVEVVAARFDPDGADGAGEHVLTLRHGQLGHVVEHRTRSVVAATGYAPGGRGGVPDFVAPGLVRLDELGRIDVARDYTADDARTVHVAGTEEHTHGVTGPDLGFGAWRSSVILATVTGREPYTIERSTAFQTFGLPGGVPDDQPAADQPDPARAEEALR